VAEGEASVEDDDDESDGEADSEADGDASEVASVFFVVEDFFGEAEADASALVLVLFFVLEELVPEVLALPDFFVVEVVAAVPVVVFFFVVADVLLAVVELAVVSFLFAHAVTNARAARTVTQHRTDFFIGVRESSLSQLPLRGQAYFA